MLFCYIRLVFTINLLSVCVYCKRDCHGLFLLQCSSSCGPGHKTRHVTCVDVQGNKIDEGLCARKGRRRRPRSVKRCRKGQCPHWKTYKWTKVRVGRVVKTAIRGQFWFKKNS